MIFENIEKLNYLFLQINSSYIWHKEYLNICITVVHLCKVFLNLINRKVGFKHLLYMQKKKILLIWLFQVYTMPSNSIDI